MPLRRVDSSAIQRLESSKPSRSSRVRMPPPMGAWRRSKPEYTRVLIGPASLPAPPWESVFTTGENLIFQESTLAVRAAYRAAGYVAAGYPREADDHLATELDFMATLAEEACTAYEAGDAERAHASLQVQRQFLSEHLNTWAKPFSDRLERAAGKDAGGLYVHFAQLCAEVCAADEERVLGLMADA